MGYEHTNTHQFHSPVNQTNRTGDGACPRGGTVTVCKNVFTLGQYINEIHAIGLIDSDSILDFPGSLDSDIPSVEVLSDNYIFMII